MNANKKIIVVIVIVVVAVLSGIAISLLGSRKSVQEGQLPDIQPMSFEKGPLDCIITIPGYGSVRVVNRRSGLGLVIPAGRIFRRASSPDETATGLAVKACMQARRMGGDILLLVQEGATEKLIASSVLGKVSMRIDTRPYIHALVFKAGDPCSIVDHLKARGMDSSFSARRELWNSTLMKGRYRGTESQNILFVRFVRTSMPMPLINMPDFTRALNLPGINIPGMGMPWVSAMPVHKEQ